MLSYKIVGDGPPLLLIHGFGISFNIWRNLAPLLSADFTLIMIELPGIGNSPAAQGDYLEASACEIERLREALKLDRWRIFSYSSGTRVAERYLEKYAEHVVNAIYLCPMQIRWHKALPLKVAKALDERIPRFGDWALSGKRLDFLIRLLGFNLQPSEYTQAWMDEICSRPSAVLKQTFCSLPDDGARPIATPPVPYLFIWGKRDLITASPRKPSARHRLINANHSAPVTEAEQAAELALPFLSTI